MLAILFILGVGITPAGVWWAFLTFGILLFGMVLVSKLSPMYTLRRSFVVLPFVLAALAVPFTRDGPTLLRIPAVGWTISEPGLISFASILLRAWLAVQAAILLTATTRVSDLFWAMSALHIPRALVGIISFMYRYLFVVADEAARMLRARAARSAQGEGRARPPIRWQGKVAGSMVGHLFLRSLERSERVYAAMTSRGYDGKLRTFQKYRFTKKDFAFLLLSAAVLAAVPVAAYVSG
jgi:cobalt/nickel transport system permease protein